MAENFEVEAIHVPQQNRRNKLRVTTPSNEEQQNPPTAIFCEQSIMNSSLQSLRDLNYQPLAVHQGLPLSLSFQLDHSQRSNAFPVIGDFLTQNGEMRSLVPLGPFTGYASILKSSKFLKPAQQILDDLCGANCETLDFPSDSLSESEVMRASIAFNDRIDYQWKNSKLTTMLDEVHRRYKLYCHQMQSIVASFETVAGLGNAAPYISYAIKFVSKYFNCLKNALLDQIHFTGKTFDDDNVPKEKCARFWTAEQDLRNQNSNLHHHVWRSQRGLPNHAVAVLKTWLFEHFLHPYPTDLEKQTLAQQTGLSRTQVSNWFINARVRLWKPMVEEVHMLESQQGQLPSEVINQNAIMPYNVALGILPGITCKRSRNGLPDRSEQRQEQRNIYFNNLASNYDTGVSGSNGVSLGLGLHQNHGIDLSWPPHINVSDDVNLETIRMMDSASATTFKAQNQHFGKGK